MKLARHHPAWWVATWFGSGLLPAVPGSWASFAALPPAYLLLRLGGLETLLVASAVLFLLGIWASARYARAVGLADPRAVVVDEVVGQWLTLVAVVDRLELWPLAFFAFRLFDVWKPWPIDWLDRRVKGGLGIMIDDLLAATYALVPCYLAVELIGS